MGPKNFHIDFIGRNDNEKRGNERQHNLVDILAATQGNVGLDVAGTIYKSATTEKGAATFDMKPMVPLYAAVDKTMDKIQSLLDKGAKDRLIVFVDGLPPPMKEEGAGTTRRRKREEAADRLKEIYGVGCADDYEEVKKLRKSIVYRREDLTAMIINECRKRGVKVFSAPFEADWQLVSAQLDNLIDVIISDDSDLFIIGGDKIVTELDYETGACCFYEREEILQRASMGSGAYAIELPALSNFLGNDYIDNLYNVGPQTARKLTEDFIASVDDNERKAFIDELQITKRWKNASVNFADGFSNKFWRAYYLQKHAPVFRLKPKSQDEPIDINDDETYDVLIEPLCPLPPNTTPQQWCHMIGFDPSVLLPSSCSTKELFLLESMPETGKPPRLLEQPRSKYPPHYPIAHGATPSDNIPVELWSNWALTKFLVERKLLPRGKYIRNNCIRLAKRVLRLMEEQDERAPQPREWKEEHQTAYDEDIPLSTRGNEQTLVWDASWDEVLSVLTQVDTLGDKDFFKLFGRGRNGIQERAKRLITGGHFDISKIQTAKCRIKSNKHDAIAIRMECVPSMKSEPYWVMLVCDLVTNEFVPAPTSRCGCPAGLGGCSHLRTEYAIFCQLLRILRHKQLIGETFTQEEASALFPACMQSMRKIPIPWKYAFHNDAAEKELKRMKRQKQHRNRENSRTLNALLTNLNSGDGVPDESESDDEDYDPRNDDDGSNEDDMTILDEETLLESAMEDDGEEQIEESDINDLIDSMTTQTDTDECHDIELCKFVEKHLDEAAARARVSESSEQIVDYKMERSKIHQNLRDVLDGKGGPNESIQTKLRQLLRQEALHERFSSGKIQKCLLSYYLLHTREQRLVLIHQYRKALRDGKTKKDVKWTAVRLEKLIAGYDGLGDRGFAGTSTSYPYCNDMKTPEFLDGRLQYTFGETVGTRDLCQGRYGSEAYNKRTNDYNFIRDKIPRDNFKHAEAVLKWAMFGANMCQPFLMPHNAGSYFPKDTTHLQKPSKRARANLSILSQPTETQVQSGTSAIPLNIYDAAMPTRYIELGLNKVGLLMDGKDCITDTVRVSSLISRALYSDKMHCSAARYIAWVLPCGLSITCTPLFLGRVSEKALVEYWGGSTYDLLCD